MNILDFAFKPHNDMDADSQDVVSLHNKKISFTIKKIKKGQYNDAVTILNENNYHDGFRASLFNNIQNKIRSFQIYLLNKFNAEPDELYSLTEPTQEQMQGKKFWIQPYDD